MLRNIFNRIKNYIQIKKFEKIKYKLELQEFENYQKEELFNLINSKLSIKITAINAKEIKDHIFNNMKDRFGDRFISEKEAKEMAERVSEHFINYVYKKYGIEKAKEIAVFLKLLKEYS